MADSLKKRAFEHWLEHGWSPHRVARWVVQAVTTVGPVVGYIVQRGSPGAVWWVVAALGVACFWLTTEVVRWRIRHSRLPTHEVHAALQAKFNDEQTAHLVASGPWCKRATGVGSFKS
jgi:hypothetical protein